MLFSLPQWNQIRNYLLASSHYRGLDDRERSKALAQYFASHQRFFVAICVGSKVNKTVELARLVGFCLHFWLLPGILSLISASMCRKALSDNKCVVIAMQATGEAALENGEISIARLA